MPLTSCEPDALVQLFMPRGNIQQELASLIDEGLNSTSLTSCSAWSAYRRIMGEPFPGPYTTKYHPWCKAMLDSQASFNYAMKAAQMGVTEVAINRAFFVLDQLKRDVLYVLPTALTASDFSKARFSVALRLSPYLAEMFTDTNTVNLKQAGITNLYIRGSRGDSNLVSIPVSELILDEVDRMDQKQIWLALERLSGQTRKCVYGISTPTINNIGIHKLFLTGTQEHFFFECPHCSRQTELTWPDCVQLVGESVNDPRCHESFLFCKECKHRLEHRAKPEFLGTGDWRSTLSNPNFDVRSWYINQLYSFTVTPGELVVAHFRGLGDECAATEFHNSKLGIPFIANGAQVLDSQLEAAVRLYTTNEDRPKLGGQRLITLGIDQGKICHWVVVEWITDRMSFDINVAAQAKVLAFGKFGEEDWHIADELMSEWQVMACVVDADPQINEARRFAKRFPGYVYPCRYRKGKVAREIALGVEEDAPIATVDRSNWLSATLGRFRRNRIILPADISFEFREHMKSLVRTWERDESKNPVMVFVDTGPDHYAHALNYAEIALPLAASITTGQDVEAFL